MEYRGIDVDLHRERFYSKAPAENYSRKDKEILESKTSLRLSIFGVPLQDSTFPFELKAILEEFIGKRLGQTNGPLNSNPAASYGYVLSILREDAQLVICLKDHDTDKVYLAKFGMIHAKTLYYILSKALQAITM